MQPSQFAQDGHVLGRYRGIGHEELTGPEQVEPCECSANRPPGGDWCSCFCPNCLYIRDTSALTSFALTYSVFTAQHRVAWLAFARHPWIFRCTLVAFSLCRWEQICTEHMWPVCKSLEVPWGYIACHIIERNRWVSDGVRRHFIRRLHRPACRSQQHPDCFEVQGIVRKTDLCRKTLVQWALGSSLCSIRLGLMWPEWVTVTLSKW